MTSVFTTNEANLVPGVYIDRSGSITSGGTSQALMAANSARRRLVIQNPGSSTSQGIVAAESLFINFSGPASSSKGNSIELLSGGSYDSDSGPCTTEQINVVAVTTGHQYFAKEMP